MDKTAKIAEKRGANTKMKFVMRVRIAGEILETEQVVVRRIENSVMRDVMHDVSIAAKRVAVLIAVITRVESIEVIP